MQKERAVVQEHQSRNKGGLTTGMQQGFSRVAAGTQQNRMGLQQILYVGGAHQEPSRAATGMQQKRQGAQQEPSRKPSQEVGRAVAGMKRKRQRSQQEPSRNSAGL